ncbi:MAG: 50S ribosomal protein L24 [Candidatus Moraniibacteriota bacterium]|nr:MAG: 50S ribosomal protein L24 [Candidatus Moranbacteria bacterium]
MKIKKGDKIRVLTGKERNKDGVVVSVQPTKGRLIVEGINLTKRHRKPQRKGEKGQIVEVNAPINVSNVALLCPKCAKATRVGYVVNDSAKKERKCKKCNAIIS